MRTDRLGRVRWIVAGIVASLVLAACATPGASVGPSPGLTAPASQAAVDATSGPSDSGTPPASILPTAGPADAVLVGAGDIGECSGGGDHQTAALLARTPGTVFAVGDLAYETGSAEEFRDCYAPTWGALRARTRPAPGNHDWMTENLAGYRGYWGPAAVNAAGDPWYSFEIGAWHAVVLDSDCAKVGGCVAGSREDAWLEQDLERSHARCTVALFHHPLFTSTAEPGDPDVFPIWDRLYHAGVDVVVNGHYHDYERFAPQDPTGRRDDARGIREFIVGTGGGPLREFGPDVAENSETRIEGVYGVLALTLRSDAYAWRFLAVDGSVRDQGSGTCH